MTIRGRFIDNVPCNHFGHVQVVIADGDLLNQPAAEMCDTAFNLRTEFGGRDSQARKGVFLQTEPSTKMPKHGSRVFGDDIEKKAFRSLDELGDRAASFDADADRRRLERRLLHP